MSDRDKIEAITNGVFAWMVDRQSSVLEAFEDGARRGMVEWLDSRSDQIVKAIADAATRKGGGDPQPPAK